MKRVPIVPLILLILTLPLAACTSEQQGNAQNAVVEGADVDARQVSGPANGGAGYDVEDPSASMPLDPELKEISALTMLEDGRIAAVQDEEGIIYLLNAQSGAIEEKVPFEEGADYEGIERVGDRLFVLQSNGSLDEVTGWQKGTPQVQTYETHLKSKNDTEGLGYDAANDWLLIVTKEDPGKDMDKDLKAIYAFDLNTNTLSEAPVFTIDTKALEDQLTGKGNFKPSALAVHPESGEVYVLSSVAKAIAVLGPDGAVRNVWNLPEGTFEQPEGLAFLPGGDLLISSEGVDRPAMLHRIKPAAE